MARIARFEDLKVWQRGRQLCVELYRLTSNGKFARDFSLKDQLRRAGISVANNIAEGFARKSRREFQHFLYISHGSIAEIQTCLYIARDLEYISSETFKKSYNNADEISRMLSGLIKYLNTQNK